MRLSKIDSARRQLSTAIRLFFDCGDEVSIFSLATNAWEIVDALCDSKGVESISNESREHIADERDLRRDLINKPYRNFFKHADMDPDDEIGDFEHRSCDPILFLAVEDYLRLVGKSPIEFQVFQLWYLAVYVDKVSEGSFRKVLEDTSQIFPNIRTVGRERQVLMGREVLEQAQSDSDLHNDPKTESTM